MTSKVRRNITKSEIAKLWAASAGRCNICYTSLLRDATTDQEVKAGEMAHIVGVADGPRSARSEHPLSSEERNKAANLILLCEKHHTEVDARPDVYTVKHLRELKRKFEERVFYLTGLAVDSKTIVLRLVGDIHDHKVADITRAHARETVLREEGRYPRWDLSSSERDHSIDLRNDDEQGRQSYWDRADRKIKLRVQQLRDMQAENNSTHISVFALARIPVLALLGHHLGDTDDMTVYHRRNVSGWGWDAQAELPEFELIQHRTSDTTRDVTLMCSISAPVQIDRAPDEIAQGNVFEIRPRNVAPGPAVLDHPEALGLFELAYREFLVQVEPLHRDGGRIYILPAVPADAAVTLGRVRTAVANQSRRIYDLVDGQRYEFACEVGA